ncbi:hypothetical protein HanRHA438_Chr17g0812361 [Helianthus annuus]|uniref:Uncharacterized protein n=1 Tax=Helianthus annuus TaxID=4232 RepID=A0A9K3DHH9_HELAN|nr:hypothetical protein HanXRQr2_Chr17g0802381 [Helianthus annuus]KAJ0826262.1 hypothetical protein HanRHA438_Chr17g0812361 [Helianthus annuus]
MLTPSPPNNTNRLPAAHALKLQRDGSTAPPTLSFFQQTASRVVSSRARRPQPSLFVMRSNAHVTSLPQAF